MLCCAASVTHLGVQLGTTQFFTHSTAAATTRAAVAYMRSSGGISTSCSTNAVVIVTPHACPSSSASAGSLVGAVGEGCVIGTAAIIDRRPWRPCCPWLQARGVT